ncbi:glutathione S-transferase family protein [Parasphingorhabdus cellanae]|uniref:Glutathione S-transferase family protein n=1 Tax=Parasphingorhabdus cellanae TaxID=2806553 RepID=A0ABX7T428_9SPHN|nr:glutathione S-transferase family protein [Parasphingorhabdus cellanae]QTD55552.1 glutathione S-transferase family protein [Parasphingorhabdus cellanae]
MTAPYILYGSPLSPFQRKAEAVLALKGLDYDCVAINIMAMPDWYLEISPLARIPALRDMSIGTEGTAGTIADSSAMCGYLEKKCPQPSAYPDDPFLYGRALWLEEYADSVLAMNGGGGVFRPIIFSAMTGKEPDLETARKTWNEKLPPLWDYLEGQLDGGKYFLGDKLSIADISIAAQLMQTDLIAGPPDPAQWPALTAFLEAMNAHDIFQRNLTACNKMLAKMVPEKFDLS